MSKIRTDAPVHTPPEWLAEERFAATDGKFDVFWDRSYKNKLWGVSVRWFDEKLGYVVRRDLFAGDLEDLVADESSYRTYRIAALCPLPKEMAQFILNYAKLLDLEWECVPF